MQRLIDALKEWRTGKMDLNKTYFNHKDFDCKCGCGKNEVKPALVDRLNAARRISKVPYHINSGTRCESNNATSGGGDDSSHLTGWAADIQCNSSRPRFRIISGLLEAGFTRIGVGRTFIHADCDPDKPKSVIWKYTQS